MLKKLTKEEIIQYAKTICLCINDNEIDWILRRINDAIVATNQLDYIDTLDDVELNEENSFAKLRNDVYVKYDEKSILSCSENKENDYLVINNQNDKI